MHPREKLLGLALRLKEQGKPIPLDLLVRAEELGLMLTELDEPEFNQTEKGEDS